MGHGGVTGVGSGRPSIRWSSRLSGTALCGRCGSPIFASPMGAKGAYYLVYTRRIRHLARRLDLGTLL